MITRKSISVLLLFVFAAILAVPTSTLAHAQAPASPKAISSFADFACSGPCGYTIQFPTLTDMTFTAITAWVKQPAVGCSTVVQVSDWSTGATSTPLVIGPNNGPSGSYQSINLTIPAGHAGVIWAFTQGTCVTPGARINITAFYQ